MQKWEAGGQGTEGQWNGGREVGEVRGAGCALKRYDRPRSRGMVEGGRRGGEGGGGEKASRSKASKGRGGGK